MNIFVGFFLILHGMVHFWPITLSQGWVEFQPDMGWTGQSWLLSGLMGSDLLKWLATALFGLAALAFITAGAGKLVDQEWARTWILAASALSAAALVLFWDGGAQQLIEKGLIGVLIDMALLVWVLWSV